MFPDSQLGELTFHRAIPGIRWRVTGDETSFRSDWGRKRLFIDRQSRGINASTRLEIQTTQCSNVFLNDIGQRVRPLGTGGGTFHKHLADLQAQELIRLQVDGHDFETIIHTDRPILSNIRLSVPSGHHHAVLYCTDELPKNTCLLLWDVASPQSSLRRFPLADLAVSGKPGEFHIPLEHSLSFGAIVLACPLPQGFFSVEERFHFGVERPDNSNFETIWYADFRRVTQRPALETKAKRFLSELTRSLIRDGSDTRWEIVFDRWINRESPAYFSKREFEDEVLSRIVSRFCNEIVSGQSVFSLGSHSIADLERAANSLHGFVRSMGDWLPLLFRFLDEAKTLSVSQSREKYVDLLKRRFHIGWIQSQRTVRGTLDPGEEAKKVDFSTTGPIPIEFYRDLWILCNSHRDYTEMVPHSPLKEWDYIHMQGDTVRRLFEYQKHYGLLDLLQLAPLRNAKTFRFGKHVYRKNALASASTLSEEGLVPAEILGVRPGKILCRTDDRTIEDVFQWSYANKEIVHTRTVAADRFARFDPYQEEPRSLPFSPFVVTGLDAETLLRMTGVPETIRRWIAQFAHGRPFRIPEPSLKKMFRVVNKLMERHSKYKPLADILFAVEPRFDQVEASAVHLWTLACIDRLTAHFTKDVWNDTDAIAYPEFQRLHYESLTEAIRAVPDRLFRYLMLADLAVWTFLRGGIGVIARFEFSNPDTVS